MRQAKRPPRVSSKRPLIQRLAIPLRSDELAPEVGPTTFDAVPNREEVAAALRILASIRRRSANKSSSSARLAQAIHLFAIPFHAALVWHVPAQSRGLVCRNNAHS